MNGEPRLGRRIAKGATWLVGLRVGSQLVDAISLIVLARLITPMDLGVVALGASIAAGIGLLQATGFGAALIQNQQASRDDYDSAWSIQLCLSAVCGIGLFAAAGLGARFFEQPALEVVLHFVALVMIMDGFTNIAVVDFQKNLDFRREVVMRFSSVLIGKLAVIGSAFYFLDYHALLVGMVVGSIVGLGLSYLMTPYRPRLCFAKARSLFAFSAWVQLANVSSFLNTHAKNFVTGSLLGPADLGLLNVSNNIATLTGQTIQGPINQASYPAFAKKAHDLKALCEHYASVLGYVTLLALPSCIGIVLLAPHVVPLALGPKWEGATAIVQILAFASFAQALTAATNPVFMALNRPNLVALFTTGRLFILIPTLVIGAWTYGIKGVACAVALVPTVMFPFRQNGLRRALQTTNIVLMRPLARPALATLFMACTVVATDHGVNLGASLAERIVESAFLVTVGVIAFALSISLLWVLAGRPDGPERDLFGVAQQRLAQLRGGGR